MKNVNSSAIALADIHAPARNRVMRIVLITGTEEMLTCFIR